MTGTGIVLWSAVVHSSKIIKFIFYCMGGNCMSNLSGSIENEPGIICHHSTNQGKVNAGSGFQSLFAFRFVGCLFLSGGNLCQLMDLTGADEK